MQWNNLYNWFEQTASQYPESTALHFESQTLTYKALQQLVEKLSQHILAEYLKLPKEKQNGVVAICLQPSFDVVISMLAIWKLGLGYLPINPETPKKRIEFILKDSQTKLIIAHSRYTDLYKSLESSIIIISEQLYKETNQPETTNTEANPTAYIMYTSGTTGEPKGVVIKQHNLIPRMQNFIDVYGLRQTDIFIHYRSYSFDSSVEEIFAPLILGASLVIAPENTRNQPAKLFEILESHAVTILFFVPSAMHVLLDFLEVNKHKPSSVRIVTSEGEKLTMSLAKRIQQYFSASLYNGYGPTENTIASLVYRCPKTLKQDPPLGSYLQGTYGYIVDENDTLVKPGEVGELLLGGTGLSEGYINRPELNTEKFIKTSFSSGKILYRSGDLARENKKGEIEFIGRADNQVKVRGNRIELSSIERYLEQHVDIIQCVVLTNEEKDYQTNILAFIIPYQNRLLSTNDLRSYLGEHLPAYMLPDQFIQLETFPITLNQKIDKKLLLMNHKASSTDIKYAMPSSIEEQIILIWNKILSNNSISSNSRFFYVGGNSLTAMQLFLEIEKQFDVRLPFETIFNCDTPLLISEKIKNHTHNKELQDHQVSKQKDKTIPLSNAQLMQWILQRAPGCITRNPVLSFRFSGTLDIEKLQSALAMLVKEQNIFWFKFSNWQPIQQIMPTGSIRLIQSELSFNSEQEYQDWQDLYFVQSMERKFNFSATPLLHAELFEHTEHSHTLFLTMPHIVSDGQSLHIIIERLRHYYISNQTKHSSLATSYADYAISEQEILTKSNQKLISFWKDYFADALFLQLPQNYYALKSESKFHSHKTTDHLSKLTSATHVFIDDKIFEQFQKYCSSLNSTAATGLVAILAMTLAQHLNQKNMVILMLNAGRDGADLQKLVGPLLKNPALKIACVRQTSFETTLKLTQEAIIHTRRFQFTPEIIQMSAIIRARWNNIIDKSYRLISALLTPIANIIISGSRLPNSLVKQLFSFATPGRVFAILKLRFTRLFSASRKRVSPDPLGLATAFNIFPNIFTQAENNMDWDGLSVEPGNLCEDRFTQIYNKNALLFSVFRDRFGKIKLIVEGPLTKEIEQQLLDEFKELLYRVLSQK